jgi:lipoate-protein ligase A
MNLLREAEAGYAGARVYSWDGVWVSLGRFQEPRGVLVDPDRTHWIGRPTGGGAVLHGHDLTVALAAPMRRSVRKSYRTIAQPLLNAFASLGVSVAFAEDLACVKYGGHHPDCFSAVSANDIVTASTHVKVCGCALRRSDRAVLLQASIPIGPPLVDPERTIVGGVRVTPAKFSFAEFATAFASGWNEWDVAAFTDNEESSFGIDGG